MKLEKVLKNIEYTTKEVIAYYLVAFKKVRNSENQTLSDYIREIIYTIEKIDKKEILKEIDTSLIAEFPFAYKLNNEELMSYGLVTFYLLLKSNKIITSKDVVSQVETVMRLSSARTIIDEADKLLDKLQK